MNHTISLAMAAKRLAVLIAIAGALTTAVLSIAAASMATPASAAPQERFPVTQLLENLENNLTNSAVGPTIQKFTPESMWIPPSLLDPPDNTQTDKGSTNNDNINNNIPFVLPFP